MYHHGSLVKSPHALVHVAEIHLGDGVLAQFTGRFFVCLKLGRRLLGFRLIGRDHIDLSVNIRRQFLFGRINVTNGTFEVSKINLASNFAA